MQADIVNYIKDHAEEIVEELETLLYVDSEGGVFVSFREDCNVSQFCPIIGALRLAIQVDKDFSQT